MTEREKMMAGLPYLAMHDKSLLMERLAARRLIQKYNQYPWPEEGNDDYFGPDDRRNILAKLFGLTLDDVKNKPIEIEPPFYCDYGNNIIFNGPFYSNFGLTVLDCAKVTFGARVLCGPNVQVYAATHSVELDERQAGYERAYPVEVGDDAWIGGQVVLCGPCKIGKGVTVASNSFVRGEFPDYCVIGGSPARILKHIKPPSGSVDLNNYRPAQ
ncbi:trimeric LpxA-like protein [Cystobasidium minutum MCA 4210]|uniref:trimeric LpxA-like protein n=1 Tax=Cystobasidium minutum MCA 4210 TaxID=1397322 RepID=UPI0034CFFF98|eukprot:jgi/Rhomi1/147760/e_gw1.9.145.1